MLGRHRSIQQQQQYWQLSSNSTAAEHRPHCLSGALEHKSTSKPPLIVCLSPLTVAIHYLVIAIMIGYCRSTEYGAIWSVESALVDGNGGGGLLMVVIHVMHVVPSSSCKWILPGRQPISPRQYSPPNPRDFTLTQVHRSHGELARVYACWMPSLDNIADSSRMCCWATRPP